MLFAKKPTSDAQDRSAVAGVPFGLAAIVTGCVLSAIILPATTATVAPSLVPMLRKAGDTQLAVVREQEAAGDIAGGALVLPSNVARSIVRASANTGVDLKLLIAVAHRESAFRPDAKARTSSATGLYQFIDSTWLGAVRDFGAKYGLAREAGMIDADGEVADSAQRACILGLRKNPDVAAEMAAEMMRRDSDTLHTSLDRTLTENDLYAAHFLGVQKAAKLATLARDTPGAPAARIFPRAARANRSIFYKGKGRKAKSRSVQGVYDRLALPYAEETGEIARKAHQIFGDLKPAGAASLAG